MILRSLLFSLTCVAIATSAQSAPRELTLFSDGTLAEFDVTAKKGVIELTLPGQIRAGTLRVKPMGDGTIGKVELLPAKVPEKLQRDLDSLTEQKNRLQDRMKALDHREGIFAAAAKAQSSKAPRKSKTNPDPLASVRQGTDFAIAQLEAVYTTRRRTEHELKRIETRLAALNKKSTAGPTLRVTVSPATAHIRAAAVLQDGGWRPRYEIRLQGNSIAQLTVLAEIADLPEGYTVKIVPGSLSARFPQQTFPFTVGSTQKLATWQLPVEKEQIANGPLPVFSFSIKNNSGSPFPSGQASVYFSGEFIGTAALPILTAGSSATLAN